MSADGEIEVDFVASFVNIPKESVREQFIVILETCAAQG